MLWKQSWVNCKPQKTLNRGSRGLNILYLPVSQDMQKNVWYPFVSINFVQNCSYHSTNINCLKHPMSNWAIFSVKCMVSHTKPLLDQHLHQSAKGKSEEYNAWCAGRIAYERLQGALKGGGVAKSRPTAHNAMAQWNDQDFPQILLSSGKSMCMIRSVSGLGVQNGWQRLCIQLPFFTVCIDMQLLKSKHLQKRFQNVPPNTTVGN